MFSWLPRYAWKVNRSYYSSSLRFHIKFCANAFYNKLFSISTFMSFLTTYWGGELCNMSEFKRSIKAPIKLYLTINTSSRHHRHVASSEHASNSYLRVGQLLYNSPTPNHYLPNKQVMATILLIMTVSPATSLHNKVSQFLKFWSLINILFYLTKIFGIYYILNKVIKKIYELRWRGLH